METAAAGLATAVPSCPSWQVKDLLRHTGYVHRWADPAVECAAFMTAPSPLAFWTRRQAHETAIHRADAELAAGATPRYPAGFAAGTSDAWSIEASEGLLQPRRETGADSDAGCTVSGPASGLYLFLWNRADAATEVTVTGDPALLASWQASVKVRWG
jgi:hypothetical protein